MTPTSPLAGLLVGLLDGGVVLAIVAVVVVLLNRRQPEGKVAAHPVAEDDAPRVTGLAREGELPRTD